MSQLILQLHLVGAAASLLFVLAATYQCITARGNASIMRGAAVGVGSYQILTGFGLVLLNPSVSLQAVCVRGLVLVGILYAANSAVSWRLAR